MAQWFKTSWNQDVSNGQLAHSLAPLTHLLARSLSRSWARGSVDYFCPIFNVLNHCAWIFCVGFVSRPSWWAPVIDFDKVTSLVRWNLKAMTVRRRDRSVQISLGEPGGRKRHDCNTRRSGCNCRSSNSTIINNSLRMWNAIYRLTEVMVLKQVCTNWLKSKTTRTPRI